MPLAREHVVSAMVLYPLSLKGPFPFLACAGTRSERLPGAAHAGQLWQRKFFLMLDSRMSSYWLCIFANTTGAEKWPFFSWAGRRQGAGGSILCPYLLTWAANMASSGNPTRKVEEAQGLCSGTLPGNVASPSNQVSLACWRTRKIMSGRYRYSTLTIINLQDLWAGVRPEDLSF